MPISFRAQVWRVNMDHEGETTATFKIPLKDLPQAMKLGESIQQTVIITVFDEREVCHDGSTEEQDHGGGATDEADRDDRAALAGPTDAGEIDG